MPLPPAPPRPPPTSLLKIQAIALVLVLGVHFLLLSDISVRQLWASPIEAVDAAPVVIATRILPPITPPTPTAVAVPTSKPVKRAPKPRKPAAAKASPVAVPVENSEAAAQTSALPGPTPAEPLPDETVAPTTPEPIADVPKVETADAVPAEPVQRFVFPPSVQLNYDVFGETDGQKNVVAATIVWKHDDANYDSSLLVTKFGIRLRQWTSKGALTATGLAPVRFGEKAFRGSEVAAHFVWDENKVIFSANTPQTPLTPGAQDHLSVFMQLASLWAGQPDRYAAGTAIAFQSIGPRQSEMWTFVVSPAETITVPGATLQATKLTREANGDYSTKAEVWLAPQLAYLPARIRLSESNGNVLDMVWTGSQPP